MGLPAAAKPRAREASTSGAAASSRLIARRTKSMSKAAPEPGSEDAGRAAGLPAPPRSHLDSKMAITFRPSSNRTSPAAPRCGHHNAPWRPTAAGDDGPRSCQFHRRERLAREPSIGARARGRFLRYSRGGISPWYIGRTGPREACSTRRTPRRNAPIASPDGVGTPASWLAASMVAPLGPPLPP